MKILLIFALLLTLALASPSGRKRSKEEEDKIADDFFKKFNKNRGRSQKDIERRRRIVIDRFYEIEEHNERFERGEEIYEQGLNELSDLSDDEIAKSWTGLKVDENSSEESLNSTVPPLPKGDGRRGRAAAPAYWNWAQYTVVQPVQNQGGCGSCYVSLKLIS